MHRGGALTAAIQIAAWLALCPSLARAEWSCESAEAGKAPEERARTFFDEALRLEPSEPSAALERLRCADKLVARPAIALRIGTVAERLVRFEEAIAAYQRYLELAGDAAPDRAAMLERISALRRKIEAQDKAREQRTPAEEPIDLLLPGIVVGGAGVVLVAVGGGLLGLAKSQSDEVHALEPGTVAWTDNKASGKFDAAQTNQSLGIAGLAVGGALAIAGATMVVVTQLSRPSSEPTVSVMVAPTGAALRFAF